MPQITIDFFQNPDNESEAVRNAVNELANKNYSKADAEKLRGKRGIFSYRVSLSARLLFTYTRTAGERELVVLEHLPNHEYERSAFLNHPEKLIRYLENPDQHLMPLQVEPLEAVSDDVPDRIVTLYQHKDSYREPVYIELSTAQEQAMYTPLPSVIMGGPGSGKSCVAMSLISQYTKTAERTEDRPLHRVVYLTQNPYLVRHMRTIWEESTRDNPVEGFIQVSFVSYEQWISARYKEARSRDASAPPPGFIGFKVFQDYFNELQKKQKQGLESLTAEELYKELRVRSGCESTEEYMNLGERQTSNVYEQGIRGHINHLYSNYRQYLARKNNTDVSLYPLIEPNQPIAPEQLYDLVVVDEAQDCSRLQLKSIAAYARDHQVVFCMDPHQDLMGDLSRAWISDMFYRMGTNINTVNLGHSYRCPEQVAAAATALIQLKYQLTGGASDKKESRIIEAHLDDQKGAPGHVLALNVTALQQQVPALYSQRNEAHFAVVVWDERGRAQARKLVHDDRIFTPAQIKGLEYSIVLLVMPFETQAAKAIEHALSAQQRARRSSAHHLKGALDKTHLASFNELITACTRASNTLVLCGDAKQHSPFLAALSHLITPVARYAELHHTGRKSSHEEWDALLVHLLQLGERQRAEQTHQRITRELADTMPYQRYLDALDALVAKEESPLVLLPLSGTAPAFVAETPSTQPKVTAPRKAAVSASASTSSTAATAAEEKEKKPISSPSPVGTAPRPSLRSAHQVTATLNSAASPSASALNKKLDSLHEGLTQKNARRVSILLSNYFSEALKKPFLFGDKENTFFGHVMNDATQVDIFIAALRQLKTKPSLALVAGYIQALNNIPTVSAMLKNKVMVAFAEVSGQDREDLPTLTQWLQGLMENIKTNITDDANQKLLHSSLYFLCATRQGQALLARESSSLIKKIPTQFWAAAPTEAQGPEANTSPLYWLCNYPEGRALLRDHPSILNGISPADLALARTAEAGASANTSPLYWLCENPEGRALLRDHHSILNGIPPEAWALARTVNAGANANTSPLYWLCANTEGRALLRDHPSILNGIPLEAWALAQPTDAGAYANTSPLYWLCYNPDGRALLREHPAILNGIPPEAWTLALTDNAGADANASPLYWLCDNPEGRALLCAHPSILNGIPPEAWALAQTANAGAYANTSSLYWLCANPEGRALLRAHHSILNGIPPAAWALARTADAGAYANVSPLHWLCANPDGRALLRDHATILNDIPPKAWALARTADAGADANASPLYWLCTCPTGIEVLNHLLNTKPETIESIPVGAWTLNSPAETSALSHLTSSDAGRAFLGRLRDMLPGLHSQLQSHVQQAPSLPSGLGFFSEGQSSAADSIDNDDEQRDSQPGPATR